MAVDLSDAFAAFARRVGIVRSVAQAPDGTPVPASDDEAVACSYNDVTVYVGESLSLGRGTLHVSNRRVRRRRPPPARTKQGRDRCARRRAGRAGARSRRNAQRCPPRRAAACARRTLHATHTQPRRSPARAAQSTPPLFCNRRVVWFGEREALAVNFRAIVMHAVSRDTAAFPRPCIYVQLDDGSDDGGGRAAAMGGAGSDEEGEGEAEDEEEEEEELPAELRLVPADAETRARPPARPPSAARIARPPACASLACPLLRRSPHLPPS